MKVKFVPLNVEFEIKPGQSVMHLAEDHGIYIKSVCRGVPSCAECRVHIKEGEANVLPPGAAELQLIGSGWFIDRRRLSCQLHCLGDVTVDVSEQVAKKDGLIGGRKGKKAQTVGDRVEEEIAIRESSDTGSDVESEPMPIPIAPRQRPAAGPAAGSGKRPDRETDGPSGGPAPRRDRGPRKNRGRQPG